MWIWAFWTYMEKLIIANEILILDCWVRNLFRKKKSGLGKSLPIGLASPVKPEVAWEFLPSSDASLWVWRQVLVSARIPENWYLYSQSSFSSFDPITPLPWWSLIMEEKICHSASKSSLRSGVVWGVSLHLSVPDIPGMQIQDFCLQTSQCIFSQKTKQCKDILWVPHKKYVFKWVKLL